MKQNKQQNGLYIPTGLAAETALNWNEKAIYSIYHYFTFYGEKSTCCITVECIAQRLGIGEQVVRRAKKHLKELNYISTDGGIKTIALKHFSDPIKNDSPDPIKIDTPTLSKMIGDPIKNDTPNPIKIDRHNKEINKENKDINLESINKEPLNNEKLINEKSNNSTSDYISDDVINESVKECTGEKLTPFNFNGEYDGLNEKLMKKAPYADVAKLNHSQRKECINWFWGKWNAYKKFAKTSRLSFDEANQYNRTFLHLAKTYFNGEVLKEVKDKLNVQITSIMRNLIMENWKLFVNSLNNYTNSECKRIRLKFESVTDFFFSDCENYNAVCDIMSDEYLQAWSNRQQTFNLSTVDELYNADYTLTEALETLKNSNLSKDDIKHRWNNLNSSTCEVSDILPTAKTQCCNSITNGDMIEWGFIPNVDYTEF